MPSRAPFAEEEEEEKEEEEDEQKDKKRDGVQSQKVFDNIPQEVYKHNLITVINKFLSINSCHC